MEKKPISFSKSPIHRTATKDGAPLYIEGGRTEVSIVHTPIADRLKVRKAIIPTIKPTTPSNISP